MKNASFFALLVSTEYVVADSSKKFAVLLCAVLLLLPGFALAQTEEPVTEDNVVAEEPATEDDAVAEEPVTENDAVAEEQAREIETVPAAAVNEETEEETVEIENKEAEVADDKKDADDSKGKDEKDDKKEEILEVGGRVHVGFDVEHSRNESEEWEDTFHIRRARLKIDWQPEEWLKARFQFDASSAFEAGHSMLKDAWIKLSPFEQLELRAGLFKKPFSGLELTSSGKLKVIERGISNEHVVDAEEGGMFYGDRDIGLELGGRLVDSIKLDYAIGVFNGSGVYHIDLDQTKDLVARLSTRPIKQFEIGASGSLKLFDREFYPELSAAGSVDVQLKIAGFRGHLEGMIAHDYLTTFDERVSNPAVSDVDLMFGAVGVLAYKFKIPSEVRLAIEPVVRVEYLDPNDRIVDDHAMLYTVGFNTYVGKYFRVMLDFEILRAERFWNIDSGADDPATPEIEDVEDHKELLLLLLCFDI